MISSDLWNAASVAQQARVTHDAWEDLIERRLAALPDKTKDGKDTQRDGVYSVGINDNGDREWRVASSYLLGDVVNIPIERQTNANTKRLAEVMRTLGWTKPTQTIRVGKQPCRGFTKPIDEPKAEPLAEQNVVVEPKAVAEVIELKPKPKTPRLWVRPL
jgi:hypothetical protein